MMTVRDQANAQAFAAATADLAAVLIVRDVIGSRRPATGLAPRRKCLAEELSKPSRLAGIGQSHGREVVTARARLVEVIVHAIREIVATEDRASGPVVMTAVSARHRAANRLPLDAANRRRLAAMKSWMISRLAYLRTSGLVGSRRSRNRE